jgi:protein-S-isoprenylcysteine O-methyltransferase Ste14
MTIVTTGVVFAFVHSLLATQRIKNRLYRYGLTPRYYRLCYVITAIILTAIWSGYIQPLPDQSLYQLQTPWNGLCRALQLLALILFWQSLRPIDTPAFLGLRSFRHEREPFIEQGIYRHIRHPMYSSIILFMLAQPQQSSNSLTLYSIISLYLILGSRLEERRMIKEHPQYSHYRQRVPAFIPVLQRPGRPDT